MPTMDRDFLDHVLTQWAAALPASNASGLGIVGRVMRLAAIFERRLERVCRVHGLSVAEFDLLATLRRQPDGALTPGRLGEQMLLSSGGITKRIDRLEAEGRVRRDPDPHDRRGVLVVLTPKGRRLADRIVPDRFDDANAAVAGLTPTERRRLEASLRKLLVAVETEQD